MNDELPTGVLLRDIKWTLEGAVHDLDVSREKLVRRLREIDKLSEDYKASEEAKKKRK